MSPAAQERLMSAIKNKDAKIAVAISQNISTFEDIADLTAQSVQILVKACLLYTSDAADERSSVDLGGRRIIKKKKKINSGDRVKHDTSKTGQESER